MTYEGSVREVHSDDVMQ